MFLHVVVKISLTKRNSYAIKSENRGQSNNLAEIARIESNLYFLLETVG